MAGNASPDITVGGQDSPDTLDCHLQETQSGGKRGEKTLLSFLLLLWGNNPGNIKAVKADRLKPP